MFILFYLLFAAEARVLILGAGTAGISAAKRLHEAGYDDFLILEGSDRVGGRAKEAMFGGYIVETGSSWVQGTYQDTAAGNNPIFDYAVEYNLSMARTDYDDWVVRNSTGHIVTEEADLAYERFAPALHLVTNQSYSMQTGGAPDEFKPDTNFKAALRRYGWIPKNPIDWSVEYFDVDFTTGRRPDLSSFKFFYDWSYHYFEEEDLFVMQQEDGGFSKIHRSILDEFISDNDSVQRLYLNQVITSIEEVNDKVYVTTSRGDLFVGDYAIITFSLGVLQNDVVSFTPPLPDWKLESIHSYDIALYSHIFMKFSSSASPFWDDVEWIAYANERRGHFNLWHNLNKRFPGSNILQVVVTDTEEMNLEPLSDQEIQDQAMDVLRVMYGAGIPEPEEILFPRWSTDPLFYGSFANWPTGFEGWQLEALKAPVGRVHFAGEALSEMYGYLQGAYSSGQNTADDVISCMMNRRSCRTGYVPPYDARGCMYRNADNYDKTAQVDDQSCVFSAVSAGSYVQLLSKELIILLALLHMVMKLRAL